MQEKYEYNVTNFYYFVEVTLVNIQKAIFKLN